MDAKIVNCFLSAGVEVTKNFLSGEIKTGELSLSENCCPSEEINIVLGVHGKLRGQIIYGMTKEVAMMIISGMMGGAEIKEIDDMGSSAIAEFSNMISGNAVTAMSKIKVNCNISPPLLITGTDVQFNTLDHYCPLKIGRVG